MESNSKEGSGTRGQFKNHEFATTQWSVVLQARNPGAPEAAHAMERLCQLYWYPLYTYVRRCGHGAHDAKDLTQEFFARLIEKNFLQSVDQERGRFRSFLLAAIKHFLANEWRKAKRLKRGGGDVPLPLDGPGSEWRKGREPAGGVTPDEDYERRWAQAVVEQVVAALSEDYRRRGKEARFKAMQPFLLEPADERAMSAVGEALGLSPSAVKSAIHQMRQRYATHFREVIARTVADPSEIDAEIRYLVAVLGKH